jgi:hypothetical protein
MGANKPAGPEPVFNSRHQRRSLAWPEKPTLEHFMKNSPAIRDLVLAIRCSDCRQREITDAELERWRNEMNVVINPGRNHVESESQSDGSGASPTLGEQKALWGEIIAIETPLSELGSLISALQLIAISVDNNNMLQQGLLGIANAMREQHKRVKKTFYAAVDGE